MKKHGFAAALLAILLVMGTALSSAAIDVSPRLTSDAAPLTLEVRTDDASGRIISGLTADLEPIPAETLLALIQSVTADDASYENGTVTATTPASTGLVVRWTNSGEEEDAPLIVAGDVLGTGVVNLSQLTRMAAALVGTEPLEGIYLAAADLPGTSSGFSLADLVQEASIFTSTAGIAPEQAAKIVQDAQEEQAGDGSSYSADVFSVVHLQKGDVIYGMLPGQSAFYTDAATVEACGGSYVEMYRILQMIPHPEFGYREQLGTYTVEEDMWVAAGYCLANSVVDGAIAGPGGGFQFVVPDFETVLVATETTDMHE